LNFQALIIQGDFIVIIAYSLPGKIHSLKNSISGWALVTHTYNPSSSGGRNQRLKASPGKK
jgi:hypothetical protein